MDTGTHVAAVGEVGAVARPLARLERLPFTAFGSSWNRVGAVIAPILIGLLLAAHLGIGSVFIMFGVAAAVGGLVIGLWRIETKQRTLEELAR